MSIVLIHPIEVASGDYRCVNDDEPYKNFTDPIFSGDATTTPKVASSAGDPSFTGDNVFNIYQSNPGPGSNQRYEDSRRSGGIKFEVTPCAEKIEIDVYGRADVYDTQNRFDNLTITIDGSQIAYFSSIRDTSVPNSAPFDGVTTYDTTVTHNFTTHPPCGHIVDISGFSGTFANNNVGYDVKVTVTLNT